MRNCADYKCISKRVQSLDLLSQLGMFLLIELLGERFSNQAGGPDSSTRRREVPLYLIVLPTVLLTVLIMACAVFYFLWRRKMAEKDGK